MAVLQVEFGDFEAVVLGAGDLELFAGLANGYAQFEQVRCVRFLESNLLRS